MKKLCLLMMLVGMSMCTFSQQSTSLRMTEDYVVILKEMPGNAEYLVDISALNLNSEALTKDVFKKAATPYVSYTVDYPNNQVTMNLNEAYGQQHNWDLADWNFYLAYAGKRLNAFSQQ